MDVSAGKECGALWFSYFQCCRSSPLTIPVIPDSYQCPGLWTSLKNSSKLIMSKNNSKHLYKYYWLQVVYVGLNVAQYTSLSVFCLGLVFSCYLYLKKKTPQGRNWSSPDHPGTRGTHGESKGGIPPCPQLTEPSNQSFNFLGGLSKPPKDGCKNIPFDENIFLFKTGWAKKNNTT